MLKMWVLGDYLMDTSFKNRVMKGLLFLRSLGLSDEMVQYVIQRTADTSKLRQWAVERIYWSIRQCSKKTEQDDLMGKIPEQLLVEVLRRSLCNGLMEKYAPIPAESQEYFE